MSLLLAGGTSPPAAAPFIPGVPQDGVRAPQRGFVDIAANLLLTTLAVAATAPFIPTLFQQPAPAKYQHQASTGYNLSIYAPPAVAAPFIPVTYPNPVAQPTARELPIARNIALLESFVASAPFVPLLAFDPPRVLPRAEAFNPPNLLIGPLSAIIGGGGEYVHHRHVVYWQDKREKRKHRSINDIFDSPAEEMYDDISKDGSKEARQKAVAIIRDFTDSKAAKPRVKSIDWAAVDRDAQAVAALLKLWSDEAFLQEEEEMIAILMLMSQ